MSQAKNGDNELAIDRLVIVSNRLPIVIGRGDLGEWQVQPGSGG